MSTDRDFPVEIIGHRPGTPLPPEIVERLVELFARWDEQDAAAADQGDHSGNQGDRTDGKP